MPYYQTQDGCRLFFELHNNDQAKHNPVKHNPTIVFLNGFTQTTLFWRYQVGKFKSSCHVITYDARAQGNSDSGDLPLTLDQHVKDLADANRNNKESLLAQLKALQTYPDLSTTTFSFQIPTLVITGSDDPMVPDNAAEQLAKHLGAQWEQIQDAGHCIPLETPDLFYSLIQPFIAS